VTRAMSFSTAHRFDIVTRIRPSGVVWSRFARVSDGLLWAQAKEIDYFI
jgi:hypothetical protein